MDRAADADPPVRGAQRGGAPLPLRLRTGDTPRVRAVAGCRPDPRAADARVPRRFNRGSGHRSDASLADRERPYAARDERIRPAAPTLRLLRRRFPSARRPDPAADRRPRRPNAAVPAPPGLRSPEPRRAHAPARDRRDRERHLGVATDRACAHVPGPGVRAIEYAAARDRRQRSGAGRRDRGGANAPIFWPRDYPAAPVKADPQRHPALASQLVFVPTIGFRPLGTRTLREPAQTAEDDVRLSVLVVAAAPDRTDILVEWEWTPRAATCPAIVASLMSREPLERTLTAAVVIGTDTIEPTRWGPRSLTSQGFARSTLTFPPLPGETPDAMLRVADGAREWRVPFVLVPGQAAATALAVHAERDGVVVRATALAHHADELTVGLEAEAAWQIRQVGAPIPTGPSFSRDSAESLRNNRQ